jgi:hypothetical protein
MNGNMTLAAERLKSDRSSIYQLLKRLNGRVEKTDGEKSQEEISIAA